MEKLYKIADHYGVDKQLDQTIEECAELIVAINKYKRFNGDKVRLNNLFEELVDVRIMAQQLQYLLRISDTIVYPRTTDSDIDTKFDQAIEKCTEIILNIGKYKKYNMAIGDVYDIALDVHYIIQITGQIFYLLNIKPEYETEVTEYKLNREISRIESQTYK